MGRFMADEADNYGGHGGAGFFSLKNDKDVAKIRFMYKGMSDIVGYAVHQVEIDGKKRYVDCKRAYNEPIDECPFCAAKIPQSAKLFIPVYDVESGTVKIWERGKKFFGDISGICSRYGSQTPLVSQVFEVERHGVKGDTGTTYQVFAIGQPDNTTFEDLPEVPDILGGFILDKSPEEMSHYLKYNEFPGNYQSANEEVPFRRNAVDDTQRRVPARGDKF